MSRVHGQYYLTLGERYWWLWGGGTVVTVIALWGDWYAIMAALAVLVFAALAFTIPAWICAVKVDGSGLVLYLVNSLSWEEVVDAERKAVLGLPYLIITRKQGMKYWVPLYVKERTKMLSQLREVVPRDNPIQCALGHSEAT